MSRLRVMLGPSPGLPEEPPASSLPPQLTVAELGWLVGTWRGEKDGDRIEEAWFEPAAGAMLGSFRWLRGERVVVYELLALESSDQGVVLHLRHFGPGLAAHEERDGALVFDLVEARPGEVLFAGRAAEQATRLGYRKGANGELVAVLERTRGGETQVDEFSLSPALTVALAAPGTKKRGGSSPPRFSSGPAGARVPRPLFLFGLS